MDDGKLTDLGEAVRLLAELERAFSDPGGSVWTRTTERQVDIVLDHPKARHALSVQMMRQLAQAVEEAVAAGPAWVVIRSSDPVAFCAGGNLDQVRSGLLDPLAAACMTQAMTMVTTTLRTMDPVTIALVEGPAIGGGAELALSCDLRFLRREAWIQPAQARLGVVNGWGGAAGWRETVGYSRALQALLQAERLDAARCQTLGLADYVGDTQGDSLLVEGLGSMALRDTCVIHGMKRQLREPHSAAQATFLTLWGGRAHREALGIP
jgi:enoyl-CoA hydratase/carnithine racemase